MFGIEACQFRRMRRIYDTLRYLGEKGTVNISFYKTDVFSIPKAEYIMFENMQPQLMKASPWQTLRNSHDKGLVDYQFRRTFRREHLGMRALWRFGEILAAITVFKPRPETPAPGQIAAALCR